MLDVASGRGGDQMKFGKAPVFSFSSAGFAENGQPQIGFLFFSHLATGRDLFWDFSPNSEALGF